ncbi:GNAT family N-acetyltransferase [Pengzhenrongella sp.]|uniref:GNAT family N-acetyltransferase n=1 Tax=Pengzhenrongella sp. TaxID=2888820 RepID=UPI002F95969F
MDDHAAGRSMQIVPWSDGDLDLLRAINTPEMTEHLGGPESEAQTVIRHDRYLTLNANDTGKMFRIVLLPERVPVGAIGYWERDWNGDTVYEAGWSVLTSHQGRGLASTAVGAVIEAARAQRRRAHLHAFPSVDNPASNAICRKVGFDLVGECEFENPPGTLMRCNDWRVALT